MRMMVDLFQALASIQSVAIVCGRQQGRRYEAIYSQRQKCKRIHCSRNQRERRRGVPTQTGTRTFAEAKLEQRPRPIHR